MDTNEIVNAPKAEPREAVARRVKLLKHIHEALAIAGDHGVAVPGAAAHEYGGTRQDLGGAEEAMGESEGREEILLAVRLGKLIDIWWRERPSVPTIYPCFNARSVPRKPIRRRRLPTAPSRSYWNS